MPRSSDWKTVGLRRLAFAFGGLVIVLLVVVFAALAWGSSERLIRPSVQRQLAQRSEAASFAIQSAVEEAREDVRTLSFMPTVVHVAVEGHREARRRGLDGLSIEEAEARMSKTRSLRVASDVDAYLRKLVSSSVFAELFVTDDRGYVVASSDMTSDFVQRDEGWWQQAFVGEEYLSNVEKDESANAVALSIADPVRDADGQIVGVLKAVIELSRVYRTVRGMANEWGYVQVVDERGRLVVDPRDENLLKPYGAFAALEAAKPGEIVRTTGEDGRPVVGVLESALDGRWRVVFWAPESEAFALLKAAQRAIGGGVILALVIGLLGVAGAGAWVSREIGRPVSKVAAAADRVGEGDLSVNIDPVGSGEVARLCSSVQGMVDRLRQLVRSIRGTTMHTQSRSEEIAGAVEQLSAAAQEMTATISRLTEDAARYSDTIREMNVQMDAVGIAAQDLAEGAASATQRSRQLRAAAADNRSRLEASRTQVGEMTERADLAAERLLAFVETSQQFGEFVDLIQGFARRTSLLSLNAAIEAARAGGEARGFAVLADEIRKLAMQAGGAADRARETTDGVLAQLESTREAIAESREATGAIGKVFESMEEGFDEVTRSMTDAERWAARVAEVSTEVDSSVQEMARRLSEVSGGVSEFAAAMEELAAGMEEQSASTEEIAAAVSALNASAVQLAGLTETFSVQGIDRSEDDTSEGERSEMRSGVTTTVRFATN